MTGFGEPRGGIETRLTLRSVAIACVFVMLALVFQAPQARATNPTTPTDANVALASRGATASASSETAGYEASKAIDGSTSTAWISAANTPTFTVTFPNKYYIVEVHVHMASISGTDPIASVAQPDIDFYSDMEGTGAWTLVKSVRGNANLDLVVSLGPTTTAKQIQARFLTPVTHTHEQTTQKTVCVEYAYDEYTGKRLGCIAYDTVTVTTTYTDTHPPQVKEFEAWGNVYDRDGDGLSNGYEETTIYRQDAAVTGLPMAIPNNGTDVLAFSLDRPLWAGVATKAFLDLEVDHSSPGDLAVAVGSWDGTAWQDRLVWTPGTYAYGSIWDTVSITTTWQSYDPYCRRVWDDLSGTFRCETYYQWTTHTATNTYPSRAVAAGTGERLVLSSDLVSSIYVTERLGNAWHVRIDLSDATLDAVESGAGFRAPALSAAELHTRGAWRILVRDWNPNNPGGTLLSAKLRTEEKSDAYRADTDGDGVYKDGQEVSAGMFPVALDTDFDSLTDVYEKASQPLVLTVNGVTSTVYRSTDPTKADTDGDGLSDGEERVLGVDRAVTDPTTGDTDGDGLWDGYTISGHSGELGYNANATRSDTDGDTIPDATEISPRALSLTINGVATTRYVTTLPYTADSDGDGLKDNEEFAGTSIYGVKTDPSDADTDDDGLADGQERFMKEVAMPTRKTAGTSLSVPLTVRIAGPVEKVTVSYGLSTIDVSKFYLKLTQGKNSVVLRSYQGSGFFNFSSTNLPSTMYGGGTYTLAVSAASSGGILEKYSLLFTIRTSPILADTDKDGLNDTEETTPGVDGWITDPQLSDTDGDTWVDAYEISTKGTNPLAMDTDGDSVQDNLDLDPLRDLVVQVKINKIHHGASPWCTPELVGIARINDAYTWVTEHRMATEDGYWSAGCLANIQTTAVFGLTYYADVPDNAATAAIRMTGWSVNPARGDDNLVDVSVSYAVNSGWKGYTSTNGNSWITYEVSTVGLAKARTLLITDGQVTVRSSAGLTRMAASDRFFVLALNLTSSGTPFDFGVNTILVPRSVFLDSKLKADFDRGVFSPLPNADLYGDDLAKASLSDGVAAVIAGTLTAAQANDVLSRLLLNASGGPAHSYIDVTSIALVANLPSDVVKILPWASVVNGPTGAMPQDFWSKIKAAATTVVNALVYVGQLIYKGLVALGTFLVNLAQAIADWGMKALGAVVNAAVAVPNKIAQAVSEFVSAFINFVLAGLRALLDPVIQAVSGMIRDFQLGIVGAFRGMNGTTTADALVAALGGVLFGSQLLFTLLLVTVGVSVAEKLTMIGSGGLGALVLNTIVPLMKDLLISALIGMAIVQVLNSALPADDQLTSLVPAQFANAAKLSFGFGSFFEKLGLYIAAKTRDFASLPSIENALRWAVFSFFLLLARSAIQASGMPTVQADASLVLLDGVAVYTTFFVAKPALGKAKGPLSRFYPLMFPVSEVVNAAGMVTAVVNVIGDTASLGAATGAW